MTYKEKIIFYMNKKQERLNDILDCNMAEKYFTNNDMKDINTWEEEECKEIFLKIKHNLSKNMDMDYNDFSTDICPFCLKYPQCLHCKYHEGCSDLHTIRYELNENGITLREVFSKEFYYDLFNKIG